MENWKEEAEGAFDELPPQEKKFVQECVSQFHYRDGFKHEDDSFGTIKISPKQFRDMLAYVILAGV